jgi:hypothetical protein
VTCDHSENRARKVRLPPLSATLESNWPAMLEAIENPKVLETTLQSRLDI